MAEKEINRDLAEIFFTSEICERYGTKNIVLAEEMYEHDNFGGMKMDFNKMTIDELILFLKQSGKQLNINDGNISVS